MARKPDTPCAVCGKLLWSGNGTLPAGEQTCRSCRRAAWTPFDCETCGRRVLRGAGGRYCSRECAGVARKRPPGVGDDDRRAYWSRKRRARKRAVESEPYTVGEIAARDGHRCQLCRRSVDVTITYPHPMSPSIDHIVPLVYGGPDVRSNVQLAHLRCNLSKGKAGSPEQLRLVG